MEPILSLALKVESQKGAYALLLGSGVSRSASIMTGWEITLDLVRRLAAAKDGAVPDNPEQWYKETFSADLDYAKLFKELSDTQEEQHLTLREYFEPTAEEKQDGKKRPTKAHRAIAKLAEQGYVRVILTTNFDRLLEQALQELQIPVTVVSTPDEAESMLPLVHQRLLVVKLHGDYLSTRIKNTPAELSSYHDQMQRLLEQVLNDFGLIICGWSGDCDTALYNTIQQCTNRRFKTYLAFREDAPPTKAAVLLAAREGIPLRISDADEFFDDLYEKVTSVAETRDAGPITIEVGGATLKRYLAEERHYIRLHDLVVKEAITAQQAVLDDQADWLASGDFSADAVSKHFELQREATKLLRHLLAVGSYYGRDLGNSELWASAIRIVAEPAPTDPRGGNVLFGSDQLRLYPALCLLYTVGVCTLAAEREDILANVIKRTTVKTIAGKETLLFAFPWSDMFDILKPMSDFPYYTTHFKSVLRQDIIHVLLEAEKFEESFLRYEFIQALLYGNNHSIKNNGYFWCSGFDFERKFQFDRTVYDPIHKTIISVGKEWPFVKEELISAIEVPPAVNKAIDLVAKNQHEWRRNHTDEFRITR